MTRDIETIREIDLFAYADGLLDDDPTRKAAVEAYLSVRPEAAVMVSEIQAQNDEIRDLYSREAEREVPGRLRDVLYGPRRRPLHRLRRVAAVMPLLLAAAGGGWLVGSAGQGSGDVPAQFLSNAVAHHRDLTASAAMHAAPEHSASVETQSLWADDRLWLEVRAPDLGAAGYDLASREKVGGAGSGTVRLVYRNAEGAVLNLFVRPRWGREDVAISREEAGGVTVHYWPAGPLAFALTTEARDAGADRLAEMIQRSVEDAQLIEEPPVTAFGNGAGAPLGDAGDMPGDTLSPANPHAPSSQYN